MAFTSNIFYLPDRPFTFSVYQCLCNCSGLTLSALLAQSPATGPASAVLREPWGPLLGPSWVLLSLPSLGLQPKPRGRLQCVLTSVCEGYWRSTSSPVPAARTLGSVIFLAAPLSSVLCSLFMAADTVPLLVAGTWSRGGSPWAARGWCSCRH